MGYDLEVVFKSKSKIKYGSRSNPVILKEELKIDDIKHYKYDTSHRILSDWRKSDNDSWPEELEMWYFHIHTPSDAKEHAELFRKYYYNDTELLELAEWLEYWSQFDITFNLDI